MIKFLVRKTIKNYEDTSNQVVREKYGVLGGVLGVICNIVLFITKLVIGTIVGAISITSDAFNNLTDSLSSIVSIVSAKLSNKKPDKDHPFGHGRIEYIFTLIVAFVILFVGAELIISSATKLIDGIKGEEIPIVETGLMFYISIGILVASLFVKLWMWSFYKYLGKAINSGVLMASSADSISDVLTSSAIIVATALGALLLKEYYFYADAIMGMIVGVIICINGFKIVLEVIGDLLGKPASKEELETIEKIVTENKRILGIHDLIIHDYGPGRKYASVHAEVDAKEDIVEAHEVIDYAEQVCFSKTGIVLTIHMDPIDFDSPVVKKANEVVGQVLSKYEGITYHDLRITDGEHNINIIFDIVVPFSYSNEQMADVIANIKKEVKEIDKKYSVVVNIDRPFHE